MARDQRSALRGPTGKLKAAVRHWLGGGVIPDETDEALAGFGLVREDAIPVDAVFKVFSLNWETFCLFTHTWLQWHFGENGIRKSMDWAQVESALKLSGIKRGQWPIIFEGLQAMQAEALEISNR